MKRKSPNPWPILAAVLVPAACVFLLLLGRPAKAPAAAFTSVDSLGGAEAGTKPYAGPHFGESSAAGDFDNDGDADLLIASAAGDVLYRNDGDGKLTDISRAARLNGGHDGRVLFLDFDHDGVLDLALSDPRGGTLYRGEGNRVFTDVTRRAGLAGGLRAGLAATDLDNDRDMDIVAADPDGPARFFAGDRKGRFKDAAKEFGLDAAVKTRAVAVDDLNGDRLRDVFFTAAGCGPNMLFTAKGYGSFVKADAELGRGGASAAALDFDNDGDSDLIIAGACSGDSRGFLLFEDLGGGAFRDVSRRLGLEGAPGPGSFSASDLDGDGDVDLVLHHSGGTRVLRNEAPRSWLRISLRGAQGSPRDGTGAKVEVKAGDLWVEKEALGIAGSSEQGVRDVLFGLGAENRVQMVRVTWPTGIRQFIKDASARQDIRIVEKGQKSSCPFLFAWDGRRFRFVTDYLGAGFIGILVGPDTYYQPDPDEMMALPRGMLAAKDGKLLLKISEQLEEVDYMDQAQLLAVDHPADVRVFPEEWLSMSKPYPKQEVLASRELSFPVRAVDGDGRDLLGVLSEKDRRYADLFTALPFEGYAEPHSLILDLGEVDRTGPVHLVLDGWLRYWTSNSAYLAAQNGLRLQPPIVEVRGPDGAWVPVVKDVGLPAGLPKTAVIDLSGKFLSDSSEVRIRTNMEAYYDRVRVATGRVAEDELRVTRLAPSGAELGWLGYPRASSEDGRPPFEYDHDDAERAAAWRTPTGYYTAYGDVRELLGKTDDMFVIMTHGEAVTLAFPESELPALPEGWARDYMFYVNGFVKEMNPHTKYLSTVEPLPFHSMSRFPYGKHERYPEDPEHLAYRKKYNTRLLD